MCKKNTRIFQLDIYTLNNRYLNAKFNETIKKPTFRQKTKLK